MIFDTTRPAPNFQLRTLHGNEIELRNFRGRQPVVLLFAADPENGASLKRINEYVALAPKFLKWNAEVFVITNIGDLKAEAVSRELPPAFRILLDPENQVRHQYVNGSPGLAIYLLDRYNAPLAAEVPGQKGDVLAADDALNTIRHSELSCSI